MLFQQQNLHNVRLRCGLCSIYSSTTAKGLTYSTYNKPEFILFIHRKKNENYLQVNTLGKEIQGNYYYYGSTALCWASDAFSVSWSYTQSVGLLWRGISLSQASTYTQNKRTQYIHALSGIWTHDPSARASEDSSCLRSHGFSHRQIQVNAYKKITTISAPCASRWLSIAKKIQPLINYGLLRCDAI
jgi:hypothetical protein